LQHVLQPATQIAAVRLRAVTGDLVERAAQIVERLPHTPEGRVDGIQRAGRLQRSAGGGRIGRGLGADDLELRHNRLRRPCGETRRSDCLAL